MGNTCKSMTGSCQCMENPLQYCKVISLQLIKINVKKNMVEKEKKRKLNNTVFICLTLFKNSVDSMRKK